jgi:hypothetical protein
MVLLGISGAEGSDSVTRQNYLTTLYDVYPLV